VTLERGDWTVPESLAVGGETLVALRAGEVLPWELA
jgi:dihydroorotase